MQNRLLVWSERRSVSRVGALYGGRAYRGRLPQEASVNDRRPWKERVEATALWRESLPPRERYDLEMKAPRRLA